jgi:four helix bundle protein
MNNLAEGWESIHLAEKKQAYNCARRSCGEVRSMTYVLLDNQFIAAPEQAEVLTHCQQTGKLITGLIPSVDRRVN